MSLNGIEVPLTATVDLLDIESPMQKPSTRCSATTMHHPRCENHDGKNTSARTKWSIETNTIEKQGHHHPCRCLQHHPKSSRSMDACSIVHAIHQRIQPRGTARNETPRCSRRGRPHYSTGVALAMSDGIPVEALGSTRPRYNIRIYAAEANKDKLKDMLEHLEEAMYEFLGQDHGWPFQLSAERPFPAKMSFCQRA